MLLYVPKGRGQIVIDSLVVGRRQIIIIDSAFPIKSDARFGSQIRQVEKVDSEQGFRIHNFNFLFLGG